MTPAGWTPEPWHVWQKDAYRDYLIEGPDATHDLIGTVCVAVNDLEAAEATPYDATRNQFYPPPDPEAYANAIRIVEAVNGCAGLNPGAYREVVRVLTEALEVVAFGGEPTTALGRCIREWEPKAKAALANAQAHA